MVLVLLAAQGTARADDEREQPAVGDIPPMVIDAWESAGLDAGFRLTEAVEVDGRTPRSASILLEFNHRLCWAYLDLSDSGVIGLAIQDAPWPLDAVSWPPERSVTWLAAPDDVAAAAKSALGYLTSAGVLRRPGRRALSRRTGRAMQNLQFSVSTGDTSRTHTIDLTSPPADEAEARRHGEYAVLQSLVARCATMAEAPPRETWNRLAAQLGQFVTQSEGLLADEIGLGAPPGYDLATTVAAWGASGDHERYIRALRAASALTPVGSEASPEGAASSPATPLDVGARVRAHRSLASDPEAHRDLLLGRLRQSYPVAIDAAQALLHYGYDVPGENAFSLTGADPDVVRLVAWSRIRSGDQAGGLALLDAIADQEEGPTVPESVWWGRSDARVLAVFDRASLRRQPVTTRGLRTILRRTSDPFVASAVYLQLPIRTDEDAGLLFEKLDRALSDRYGAIAVTIAIEFATTTDAGRAWSQSARVQGMLRRAATQVQLDPRPPWNLKRELATAMSRLQAIADPK